ncbi:major facilitator superfamily [Heterobasidion irregulare TC 32-1]|uniref:Major facilitator superfamily n=1 Tax=Heterobasidion irregulare (strain TC 32-1) TaxID=747525 RepID=W4JNC3_HETIT|nr:major facilitator superfamily [Heterobasidion irregulare TC 32-1]ETW74979.1 major facilitator superfamily [Heterobasidion irregulare TC 32-1]
MPLGAVYLCARWWEVAGRSIPPVCVVPSCPRPPPPASPRTMSACDLDAPPPRPSLGPSPVSYGTQRGLRGSRVAYPVRSHEYCRPGFSDGAPGDSENMELVPSGSGTHLEERRVGVGSQELLDEGEDEGEGEAAILDKELDQRNRRPWLRRPAPWCCLSVICVVALGAGSTAASQIAVLTNIMCEEYKRGLESDSTADLALSRRSSSSFNPHEAPIVCASNPVVQAETATVLAAMATITGILSCLTTAWWGSLSDRHGRTFVSGFCTVPVTDLSFILVTQFPALIPGGYRFLFFGCALQGSLGGVSALIAAMHGYLADCTAAASRVRVFSLFFGFLYTGAAVGPTLGSLIIRTTSNDLSVFYFSVCVNFAVTFLLWLVVPESLLPTQIKAARRAHEVKAAEGRRVAGFFPGIGGLFGFLAPLGVFAPVKIRQDVPSRGGGRRDWDLTLVGIAYGSALTVGGNTQVVLQYAAATYMWSTEMLGYLNSVIGVSRAVFLALLLPCIIHAFGPKPNPIHLPMESSEPSDLYAAYPPRSPPPVQEQPKKQERHSPAFDLTLARTSLFVEIVVYALAPFASTGSGFMAAVAAGSLGAGFAPTMQSLALELYRRRGGKGSGKVFGALGLVHAASAHIVGPAMFGFVYLKTVGVFPRAVFFVVAALLAGALGMLGVVRLAPDARRRLLGAGDLEGRRQESAPLLEECAGGTVTGRAARE